MVYCRNGGYVSVAEMGKCGQLQKWGVCIAETGGMCFLENILECEQYAQFSDIVTLITPHSIQVLPHTPTCTSGIADSLAQ